MIKNNKKKLLEGIDAQGSALGLSVLGRDSLLTELVACQRFDWLMIDNEHGHFTRGSLLSVVQAINDGNDSCVLIRTRNAQPSSIQDVVDLGIHGVVISGVRNCLEAETASRAAFFPPKGTRGVGLGRSLVIGGIDYLFSANQRTLCLVMIENASAVAAIDDIVKMETVDGVILGPADLGFDLIGLPMLDQNNEKMAGALEKVVSACKANGKLAGIFAQDVSQIPGLIKQGWQLIGAGTDLQIFSQALAAFKANLPTHRQAV